MNDKSNIIVGIATLALSAFTPVVADESAPSDPPVRSDAPSNVLDSENAGVGRSTRVFRNSGTAQLEFGPAAPVPISGLSARERNMLSRSDENLRARVLSNRAVALNLQGRFQNMVMVTAEQNTGRLITSCSIDYRTHPDGKVELDGAE